MGWYAVIVGYILTAITCGSLGFLTGSLLSFSKIRDLYDRIDATEVQLRDQGKLISDLGTALVLLLEDYRILGGNSASSQAATLAEQALTSR